MSGNLYSKPVMFSVVATVTILIGTAVTMFYPMFTPAMHPKLDNLKPYTALQLAGKNIYQREGCNNCHTQTVRPLRTEVLRYGEYSKAGEFAYDRPFLWGSKRTGPDLARIGGKYHDMWHYEHFIDPRMFFEKSNMPAYTKLQKHYVKSAHIRRDMEVLGLPYTSEEIADLFSKTQLDALVAYMQVIGTAVTGVEDEAAPAPTTMDAKMSNPLEGNAKAIAAGKSAYESNCAACHGDDLAGSFGPNLIDNEFAGKDADGLDGDYFNVISAGTEAGMPSFESAMTDETKWSIVSYIRSMKQN